MLHIANVVATVRGSDSSIAFGIVDKFFFSVSMITHEPLHLALRNFALTCTLTTSGRLLSIRVKGQGHMGFCVRVTLQAMRSHVTEAFTWWR